MFVPSRTADNTILLQNDPNYRNRILAATGGNDALRKAWLEGDWNVVCHDGQINLSGIMKPKSTKFVLAPSSASIMYVA